MAMFMIDSQVLWTTTARDLCTRLHSANLVPLECPIVLVEVSVYLVEPRFEASVFRGDS